LGTIPIPKVNRGNKKDNHCDSFVVLNWPLDPGSALLFEWLVPGTDVMILKNIFAEKFGEKIGVFLLKLLLVFAKIVIITLFF
jgi:hypothetical protein